MEELIQKMVETIGIDRATDDEAVAVTSKSGLEDKLPGGLGDKLGGHL